MKTLKLKTPLAIALFIFLINADKVFSQGNNWKLSGNTGVDASDFIGTINNADLNFRTTNTKRMTVKKNGGVDIFGSLRVHDTLHVGDSSFTFISNALCPAFGATDEILSSVGRVAFGFGPSTPPFFSLVNVGVGLCDPKNKIHLHEDNPFVFGPPPRVFAQFTNGGGNTGGTGSLATDGFLVGIGSNGTGIIRQQENLPIQIQTNGANQRMIVFHDPLNNPRVGIGSAALLTTPITYLHLGANAFAGGGYRTWMNVGTYMNSTLGNGFQVSDNMYVGLREYSPDRTDAIISWGNNPTTQPNFTDRLRFVFTAATLLALPASVSPVSCGTAPCGDGLEIARMISDGSNGFIGLGGDGFSNLTPFPNPYNSYSNGADPGNTVEINTAVTNANSPAPQLIVNNTNGHLAPNPLGGTGFSGLRFTDLTSASTPVTTIPTTNVLSVSVNGDVILVPGGSAPVFSACGSGLNPLLANSEIFLNNKDFVFRGNNINDKVGIGTGCIPGAKLDVFENNGPIGARSIITGFNTIAGWFQCNAPPGSSGFAVIVPPNGGRSGFGTTTPGATVEIVGTGLINNAPITSDVSLKTNVNTLTNSLNKILRLRGVSFNWIPSMLTDTFMYGIHNGFIAQEVDTVIPNVVRTKSDGKKTVAYQEIIPLLVGAIKEQQSQIDSLKNQINSCCSSSSRIANNNNNNQNVDLTSDAILYQNMPNPFNDETIINYYLPDNVSSARMIFYDETGRMVKEESILNRGNGSLTVNSSNLAAGIYSYCLEVDGRTIQTRKMQRVK